MTNDIGIVLSLPLAGSSYLGVYGTQQVFAPSTDAPIVECYLDGLPTWSFINVGAFSPVGVSNNMLACRADSSFPGSSPGEHELLINYTNKPKNLGVAAWYLDYITFESLADPVLDGEVLQAGNGNLIDSTNYSMLTFGTGWSVSDVDDSMKTDISHSTAAMKFNGKSLQKCLDGLDKMHFESLLNYHRYILDSLW